MNPYAFTWQRLVETLVHQTEIREHVVTQKWLHVCRQAQRVKVVSPQGIRAKQ